MKRIYTIKKKYGRELVLRSVPPRDEKLENANFLGTGMALSGVLRRGEKLEEWKVRVGR